MKYDFDSIVDRRGTNSVKWDICPDPEVIPMWVADMDFKAAPFILDALHRKVDQGVFGYTHPLQPYYDSVIDWFSRRRGWKIEKEWITPISGIVPALSIAVEALSKRGEGVVIQSPAYNCFFSSIRNNGRVLLENKLLYNEAEGSFSIDFEDFERKCADPNTTLYILCNPHNPSGRIWTADELRRLGEICLRHGVTIVADEIHCELEMPGFKYTPFASLSAEFQDSCVTFVSPSKSFNLAGLEIANIVCKSPEMREKIDRVINTWEHCDVNQIGVVALEAAYTQEGEEWLRQLNEYLAENYRILKETVGNAVPQVRICRLEGTYLVWMDCRALTSKGISTQDIQKSLTETEKVWINSGKMYGDEDFMRINIACPRALLAEGASRLAEGLKRIVDEWNK